MKYRGVCALSIIAAWIGMAIYALQIGALTDIDTTMALVPESDVAELDFFLTMSDVYGPGNYTSHTVVILCSSNNVLSTNFTDEVETAMSAIMTEVTAGDMGYNLYVDAGSSEAAELYVMNYTALITVQYLAPSNGLVNVIEDTLGNLTDVTVQVLADEVLSREENSEHSFDVWSVVTAFIGIAILGFAIWRPQAALVTILNIFIVYTVSFWAVAAQSKSQPLLGFGPQLMLAEIIAFSIDYSLFLIQPYVRAAREKELDSDSVIAILVHESPVILISASVLSFCFLTLLYFREITPLSAVGYGCTITIVITAACNLTMTPALLYFKPLRDFILPAKGTPKRKHRSWYNFPEPNGTTPHGGRRTLIVVYLALSILAGCWVFGAYDKSAGAPGTQDAGHPESLLGAGHPFVQATHVVNERYGVGTTTSGMVHVPGNASQNNATIECLRQLANITTGNVMRSTGDSRVTSIKPPVNLRKARGVLWYHDTIPEALEKCGALAGGKVMTFFEDQLALDAIDAVWPKFTERVIPTLFGICFIVVWAMFGSPSLALYAVIGMASMFCVSLAFLRAVYPDSHTDVFVYPDPGSSPLAYVWFVPIMVFPVVVGIKLDYVTLRLHAWRHRADSAVGAASVDNIIRQAVHESMISVTPTVMYAGLIMVVAFSGLYAQSAVAAKQIATMLIASLAWVTWLSETFVQPSMKYEFPGTVYACVPNSMRPKWAVRNREKQPQTVEMRTTPRGGTMSRKGPVHRFGLLF